MVLTRRLREALRLLVDGKLRQLGWQTRLWLRGVDIDFADREQLGYTGTPFGHHSITPGPELRKVLRQLEIGPADTVMDMGCGKGSALFTLAEFPFGKVTGCDYSQELIDVATLNLTRLGLHNVDVECCDATQLTDFGQLTHLFLFNPFTKEVFEILVENLCAYLAEHPRDFTIIYRNPKSGHLIEGCGLFHRTREFDHGQFPYYIYEYEGPKNVF